ncbi:MAG: hypothetical protein K0R82_1283 [Flavipsychrobacter sp.]|nr:hypothetical protein [Flavipsychrobacter sp.]
MHSPFVYAFIEDGIQKIKAASLKELLRTYFTGKKLVFMEEQLATRQVKILFNNIKPDTIIAIKDIHATQAATDEWDKLSSNPQVRLSIDLYQYGLLFFDPAFKQKQHFIVKYPA